MPFLVALLFNQLLFNDTYTATETETDTRIGDRY